MFDGGRGLGSVLSDFVISLSNKAIKAHGCASLVYLRLYRALLLKREFQNLLLRDYQPSREPDVPYIHRSIR